MTEDEIITQAKFKAADAITRMADAMDNAIVVNSETLGRDNLNKATREFLELRIEEQKKEASALRMVARGIFDAPRISHGGQS